ncbi:MAG TPA: hypothetical protein VF692_01250 [Pyrinomonadaceae bacterium]|jgi:hypothetical protein
MNYAGSIALANTSQEAATNRQDRSRVVIQNLSDDDQFFNFGAPAVIDQGIFVAARSTAQLDAGGLPQVRSKIFVISAAAGGKFSITDDAVDM